jgi:hypothetical protein
MFISPVKGTSSLASAHFQSSEEPRTYQMTTDKSFGLSSSKQSNNSRKRFTTPMTLNEL